MNDDAIKTYACWGSTDPQIVRRAFLHSVPIWQTINLQESNRLEDARVNVGYSSTSEDMARKVHSEWLVVTRIAGIRDDVTGYLPTCRLSLSKLTSFFRYVENLVIEDQLTSILVYSSEKKVSRILPDGPRFRQLMKATACISFFSRELNDPQADGFSFLIESRSLSLLVTNQNFSKQSPESASQIIRRSPPDHPNTGGKLRIEQN